MVRRARRARLTTNGFSPFALSKVSEAKPRNALTRNSVLKLKHGLKIPFVLSLSKDELAHWPRVETPFDGPA